MNSPCGKVRGGGGHPDLGLQPESHWQGGVLSCSEGVCPPSFPSTFSAQIGAQMLLSPHRLTACLMSLGQIIAVPVR